MARIALLFNLNRGESQHELEFDRLATISELERALRKSHEVTPIECTRDAPGWAARLVALSPDLVFSVAEGYPSSTREAFYPALYEQLGLRYVGSEPTAMMICQNKHLSKQFARSVGMRTPEGQLFEPEDAHQLDATALTFPVIVKPNTEGSSIGISAEAIVRSYKDLRRRCEYVWNDLNNLALVETLIEGGRDLSLSYVEGFGKEIFGPSTYNIGNAELYDYNWKERSHLFPNIVLGGPNLSADVRDQLYSQVRSLVSAIGIKGYARFDFKQTGDGLIHFLEINGQVEMASGAEFAAAAVLDGALFDDLVLHIAEVELQRPQRTPRKQTLRGLLSALD